MTRSRRAVLWATIPVLAMATALAETPPPPLNAKFELTNGSSPPGGMVDVILRMRADAGIQGAAWSIDFDEEVLEAIESELLWEKPDGSPYEFDIREVNNKNVTPGSAGVDEGFVIGGMIFDLDQPVAMPANTDVEAVRYRFRVRPETTASTTELRFIDGGKGTGQGVVNIVAANGHTQYTRDSATSFIFITGFVGVVPDILTFVRGDSNGDARIDISDALRTLNYLFLNPTPPACYDAADADDSGLLDIADGVYTLNYLFSGASPPPVPHPDPGPDPTPDTMSCLRIGT